MSLIPVSGGRSTYFSIAVNGTVDTADSLNKRLNKIGTIAVKVYRVNKIKGKRGKRSKGKSIKELRGMKEVSEENLKGASMTHTTKYVSCHLITPNIMLYMNG